MGVMGLDKLNSNNMNISSSSRTSSRERVNEEENDNIQGRRFTSSDNLVHCSEGGIANSSSSSSSSNGGRNNCMSSGNHKITVNVSRNGDVYDNSNNNSNSSGSSRLPKVNKYSLKARRQMEGL